MQGAMGRASDARASLEAGKAALARASDEAKVRYRVFRKVALWQQFEDEPDDPAATLVAECAARNLERDRTFLLSWDIPWLATTGDRRTAHPLIRDFRQEAAEAESMWRLSDVTAFQVWMRTSATKRSTRRRMASTAGTPSLSGAARACGCVMPSSASISRPSMRASTNSNARHAASAPPTWGTISSTSRRLPRLGRAPWTNRGMSPAESGVAREPRLGPRAGGSGRLSGLAALGEWLECLDRLLPSIAMTSIVWPVARPRILGLLALRAGMSRARRTC